SPRRRRGSSSGPRWLSRRSRSRRHADVRAPRRRGTVSPRGWRRSPSGAASAREGSTQPSQAASAATGGGRPPPPLRNYPRRSPRGPQAARGETCRPLSRLRDRSRAQSTNALLGEPPVVVVVVEVVGVVVVAVVGVVVDVVAIGGTFLYLIFSGSTWPRSSPGGLCGGGSL